MAAADRDTGWGGESPLLQRVVRIVKFVFRAAAMGDTLSVPKP
jgi:hypothetical protein